MHSVTLLICLSHFPTQYPSEASCCPGLSNSSMSTSEGEVSMESGWKSCGPGPRTLCCNQKGSLKSKCLHVLCFSFGCFFFFPECLWLSLSSVHRSPHHLVFCLLSPSALSLLSFEFTTQNSPPNQSCNSCAHFYELLSRSGAHSSLFLCSCSHVAHTIFYFLSSLNTRP